MEPIGPNGGDRASNGLIHRPPRRSARDRRQRPAPPATSETGVVARIGLVPGAGGVTGGAFHAGVLAALAAVTG
jgi:predicted acylesterase/phospholipase RssA